MFYNIDKRIGKKVWLFEKNPSGWNERLVKDKEWVIESLHEPEVEFYDYYFVVSNGTESRKVFWHDTVVIPEDNEDEQYRIEKYLSDNGFYFEYISREEIAKTPLYRISITWGDWKHDHGWLNSLMGYIDYECFNEIVTEENGSDCYSADHFFVSKNSPNLNLLHDLQKIFA